MASLTEESLSKQELIAMMLKIQDLIKMWRL